MTYEQKHPLSLQFQREAYISYRQPQMAFHNLSHELRCHILSYLHSTSQICSNMCGGLGKPIRTVTAVEFWQTAIVQTEIFGTRSGWHVFRHLCFKTLERFFYLLLNLASVFCKQLRWVKTQFSKKQKQKTTCQLSVISSHWSRCWIATSRSNTSINLIS